MSGFCAVLGGFRPRFAFRFALRTCFPLRDFSLCPSDRNCIGVRSGGFRVLTDFCHRRDKIYFGIFVFVCFCACACGKTSVCGMFVSVFLFCPAIFRGKAETSRTARQSGHRVSVYPGLECSGFMQVEVSTAKLGSCFDFRFRISGSGVLVLGRRWSGIYGIGFKTSELLGCILMC